MTKWCKNLQLDRRLLQVKILIAVIWCLRELRYRCPICCSFSSELSCFVID